MSEKLNNINGMLKNPQQRNIFFALIGVAVVGLGIGALMLNKKPAKSNIASGASVTNIPNVQAVPGTSDSNLYNQQVIDDNAKRAAEAAKKNGSFIPVPVNNQVNGENQLNKLEQEKLAQAEAERLKKEQELSELNKKLQMEEEAERLRLAALKNTQAPRVVQTAVPVATQQKKYSSEEERVLISTLLGAWSNRPSKSEFNFAGQEMKNGNAGMEANQAGSVNSSSAVNAVATNPAQNIATAGTIFNAILETAINSDEPSPVLAKIVSGPLNGTRLIGSMNRVGGKVILQFSTASMPNAPKSMKLSAIAIDPNTTRTGLATDVDNHYFLKYGVLLGAAFLGGYADAISRQNTTTVTTPEGNVVSTQGQLSSKDINRMAVGSVGKELANQTKQSVQGLQPTVTVDSGSAIGILLMEDLPALK